MTTASETRSLDRIQAALASAGKRAALAHELGISEGQLSKMLTGELRRFAALLDLLGLEAYPQQYVDALRSIIREEI
jgi:hypothetical protein